MRGPDLAILLSTATSIQPSLSNDLGPFAQPPAGSAAAIAPSHAPLEAAQPTSVAGTNFIDTATVASQDFDEQIAFTPSVGSLQPAWPVSLQNVPGVSKHNDSATGFSHPPDQGHRVRPAAIGAGR